MAKTKPDTIIQSRPTGADPGGRFCSLAGEGLWGYGRMTPKAWSHCQFVDAKPM